MLLLAIDPGSEVSAIVLYETNSNEVIYHGKHINSQVLEFIKDRKNAICLIEKPDFVAKGAGKEVINTIFWAGRFFQKASNRIVFEFGRNELKKTYSVKNDKEVRQFILTRYNVKLTRDSWQAFLLIHHYLNI